MSSSEVQRLGELTTQNPTLTLLAAYSRDWVIPLFAAHLEHETGSVSAAWFHDRVADALATAREGKDWKGDRTPSEHCAWWVERRWLETEMSDDGVRYRLSPYSMRALRFVREVSAAESSVSGSRLGSIADAVRRLADMAAPDRETQKRRIEEQIAALQERWHAVDEGRGGAASTGELSEQLREVLDRTRALPADFRQLRSMVEERHKLIARDALAQTPKGEMVESYLREHDLLDSTPEGTAYRGFARMLASSRESTVIQQDLRAILAAPFARDQMTPQQRAQLEGMFSMLMGAELEVNQAYVRWTGSLRRVLTRAAHNRHTRILALTSRALDAGAEWVANDPVSRGRELPEDILGVGSLNIEDVTQLQLWRDTGPAQVKVSVAGATGKLPEDERAALRLAAGTSHKAVAKRINDMLAERKPVTAAEVYAVTPQEFQRLGALVTMLDLALRYGTVDADAVERVRLATNTERELEVLLPHLSFHRRIKIGKEGDG